MVSNFKLCVQFINPAIPDRNFDWGVYMEGEVEEGYKGYGATPTEAIQDFINNAGESHETKQ